MMGKVLAELMELMLDPMLVYLLVIVMDWTMVVVTESVLGLMLVAMLDLM